MAAKAPNRPERGDTAFIPAELRPPARQPAPIAMPDRAAVEKAEAIRDARSKRTLQRHQQIRKAVAEADGAGFLRGYEQGRQDGRIIGIRIGTVQAWRWGCASGVVLAIAVIFALWSVLRNIVGAAPL